MSYKTPEEEQLPPPPPKKTSRKGKFRRWLGTSTGKGATVFVAAGATAILSPDVGQAITTAADGMSKGDLSGLTAVGVALVLGYFRSRSL
jgi:hypothetical protein